RGGRLGQLVRVEPEAGQHASGTALQVRTADREVVVEGSGVCGVRARIVVGEAVGSRLQGCLGRGDARTAREVLAERLVRAAVPLLREEADGRTGRGDEDG